MAKTGEFLKDTAITAYAAVEEWHETKINENQVINNDVSVALTNIVGAGSKEKTPEYFTSGDNGTKYKFNYTTNQFEADAEYFWQ